MHRLIRGVLSGLLLTAATDAKAAEPIRIALIGADGSAEAGFRLGLDATIHGRRVELATGSADITVAFGSSETVKPLLATAEAAKRILIVAEAGSVATSHHVFQTAPDPEAMATAVALTLSRPELNLLVAAENRADDTATAAALKRILGRHNDSGFFVGTRLIPSDTADVGAKLSPEFDGLHDLHGSHTLLTIWSGPGSPIPSIDAAGPEQFGVRLVLAGPLDPNAPLPAVTFTGVTSYSPGFPRNPLNDRLVAAWQRRFKTKPDEAAAAGMTAALAVTAALKAAPSTDGEALIKALEGRRFQTPKGAMVIGKQDHRTAQALYQYRVIPGKPAPVLEHEYAISELSPDR